MREVTVLERLHEAIGGLQMLWAVIASKEMMGKLVDEQFDACVMDLIEIERVIRDQDENVTVVTRLKVGMPKGDDHEQE